ncbi:hypothetical protein ABBQ32_012702 [Trebouxia sp. C0010 RCD-2024]
MHSTVFGSCLLPIVRLQKARQHDAFCKTPRPGAAQRLTAIKTERSGSCRYLIGFSQSRSNWLRTAPYQASSATIHSRTVCSAAESSQDFTEAATSPLSDESRQASNAAASTSTSSSQPAISRDDTKPPASQNHNPFVSLTKMLLAVFRSIAAFFKAFPAFVQREKLQRLHKRALDNPTDADRSQAFLAELNKRDPKAVLRHVDNKTLAVNPAVIVEYLKALVKTNRISQYSIDGAVGDGQDHRSLSQLLKDLEKQADGDAPSTDEVGSSVSRPLHVVVQNQGQRAPSGPFAFLSSLFVSVLCCMALVVLFVLGSGAIRRYSGGGAGALAGGPSAAITGPGGSSYAPKEYNKENMPEKNQKTFQDVKGCPEAKAELEEVVEYLKHPDKFTKLGGKLPKGVLLTGPPGTGKTLLAKAVAGEAGVPFFYRAGSEFEEMFVGVGSRRVRSLFAAAKKKAPCIVFIDEIDAVGGSRKQWENHTRKTLNQLLTEMDGFEANEGVIVMAATNLQETLDPALTRPGRFDRRVAVPMPDVRGRLEILEHYLKDKPRDSTVSAAILARQTPGFSGAELSNLVNEAALLAAKTSKTKLSAELLESARDKAIMGVERKSLVQSAEARKLTAYHEGGHALVAMHTRGAHPIHKATIVPRGHALGMVSQLPDKDEFSQSKRQMLARIDVCMGGKVAEEVIFGRDAVTSGARSDLQQATSLARHMVTECGMSDELGPVYLLSDGHGERATSGDTQRRIDAEVTKMLREAYKRVTTLLTEREGELHTLARALLEHETLTRGDIQQVLDGTFTKVPVAREAAEAEVEGLLTGHSYHAPQNSVWQ